MIATFCFRLQQVVVVVGAGAVAVAVAVAVVAAAVVVEASRICKAKKQNDQNAASRILLQAMLYGVAGCLTMNIATFNEEPNNSSSSNSSSSSSSSNNNNNNNNSTIATTMTAVPTINHCCKCRMKLFL